MLTPTTTRHLLQRQITLKITQQRHNNILPSPLLLLTTQQQQQHLPTTPHHQRRHFAGGGSRGSKGHGWLHHYRRGQGGRHLQGRWHNRNTSQLRSINEEMFALGTSKAYLDFRLGKGGDEETTTATTATKRRVVIELAERALPTTCRNFRLLCSSAYEDDGIHGYKSSKIHKIEKNVGLMLGDIFNRNGAAGRCHPSIGVDSNTFADEAFVLSHVDAGMVSMMSPGVDRNDSRFVITVGDAPQLDGRFVCFGRVVEGMEVVKEMSEVFTRRGVPSVEMVVVDCGVVG